MRIIREITERREGRKARAVYICSDGIARTILECARYCGICRASMVSRLHEWGHDHPEILSKKSSKQRAPVKELAIKLDIKAGDLAGKFNGRTKSHERRKMLDRIPSPTAHDNLLFPTNTAHM